MSKLKKSVILGLAVLVCPRYAGALLTLESAPIERLAVTIKMNKKFMRGTQATSLLESDRRGPLAEIKSDRGNARVTYLFEPDLTSEVLSDQMTIAGRRRDRARQIVCESPDLIRAFGVPVYGRAITRASSNYALLFLSGSDDRLYLSNLQGRWAGGHHPPGFPVRAILRFRLDAEPSLEKIYDLTMIKLPRGYPDVHALEEALLTFMDFDLNAPECEVLLAPPEETVLSLPPPAEEEVVTTEPRSVRSWSAPQVDEIKAPRRFRLWPFGRRRP